MLKRIVAITFILACTSVAWFILAATIFARTYAFNDKLKPGVASIWGSPQEQKPPTAGFDRIEPERTETEVDGKKTLRTVMRRTTVSLPAESSRITAGIKLDYRQKGLLWYSTYVVDFVGAYTFRNTTSAPQVVTFRFKLPVEKAIYDTVTMEVNDRPKPFNSDKQGLFTTEELAPGAVAAFRVGYRSQGMESWRYKLGDDGSQARDFLLSIKTDFKQVDFPPDALSPTEKREIPGGWELTWRYRNLISGFQIGVTMPEKLQPGPLAGEISYFAPVSLLLFFFLMFIITALRDIDLHPMNYFFLAAAFFAFHLLLAYLVDHISIHLAFAVSSLISVFLVVSYLRIVTGLRFAVVEAGAAQFVYLVLFSYAFFIKGFTGLAVTLGCVVTLFLTMQLTARIRWTERFAPRRGAA